MDTYNDFWYYYLYFYFLWISVFSILVLYIYTCSISFYVYMMYCSFEHITILFLIYINIHVLYLSKHTLTAFKCKCDLYCFFLAHLVMFLNTYTCTCNFLYMNTSIISFFSYLLYLDCFFLAGRQRRQTVWSNLAGVNKLNSPDRKKLMVIIWIHYNS